MAKIQPYSRIVVEGMDGSGKSTLVENLLEWLGDQGQAVPGYNRQPASKPPLQQWWMEQLAHNPENKVVIHDRFYYPELVYGPVLRNRIDITLPTRSYVEDYLRRRAFLIYCRPSVETLEKGVMVEDQMKGVRERFHDLLLRYDKLMVEEARHYSWRFMLYDWTDDKHLGRLYQRLSGYIYG